MICCCSKWGVAMPKYSSEQLEARREEILDVCEKLYQTKSYKEITIKEIGKATSFTRTSIYNYFQTKEEIFLALEKREYDLWVADLLQRTDHLERMNREEFAGLLAESLEKRMLLLKLLSMNHFDTESGSRLDHLTAFKRSYGRSMHTVLELLDRFFPDITDSRKQDFIYAFFPFMFGIYPYAVVTDKQKKAMEDGQVHYIYCSVSQLIRNCVLSLLD